MRGHERRARQHATTLAQYYKRAPYRDRILSPKRRVQDRGAVPMRLIKSHVSMRQRGSERSLPYSRLNDRNRLDSSFVKSLLARRCLGPLLLIALQGAATP